jgi:putative acetyltransferase
MIALRSIHPDETEAAKALMATVFRALWGFSYAEIQARYDPLEDIEQIQFHYFENGGTFMVLADGEQLVGTGGISRLDTDTAELKRIFLLQEYRGRGLGRRLVETLLEFARTNGYRRVRLMVATPDLQPEAVGLYTSLGFHPLQSNPNDSGELHMVLALA